MSLTTKQINDLNNSMIAMRNALAGNLLDKVSDMTVSTDEINSLDVSVVGGGVRFATAPLTIVALATSNDTAIIIPKGAVIEKAYVIVEAAEATGATKTIDIGISGGDEDGILKGISVAAIATLKGTLLNTGQTLGALMSVDEDGAGALSPEPYVCTAATTIAYTLGSDDFAELVANVVVEYRVFE